MDQGKSFERKPSPKDEANIVSVLTFFYTLKIFIKGFRKDLEEEDIYKVTKKLQSEKVADRLEKQYLTQKAKSKKCTLLRVIWQCYGKQFLIFGFCELFLEIFYGLTIPNATGKLVGYFSKNEGSLVSRQEAYLYASEIVLIQVLSIFVNNNLGLLITEFTLKVRAAFCSLIYRKCLKLHPSALSEFPTGKILTLMTKDIQSVESFLYQGCSILTSMLVALVMTGVLYNRIGSAAFVGIGILLLITPLQVYIGKIAGGMRISSCKRADIRLQAVQEVLSAIKIIKMYTWEPFFLKKISAARKAEIHKLRKINCFKQVVYCIGLLTSSLSFYLLIITFIRYGTDVTPENIFYTVQMYDYIKYLIASSIPYSVIHIAEFGASIKRIGGLLDAEELSPPRPKFDKSDINGSSGIIPTKFLPKLHTNIDTDAKIVLTNVSSKIKDKIVIKNASCTMTKGLHIITGPLGSGKSSLLKIILKEYPLVDGTIELEGDISYASQDPWIFPASIRNNILFGAEYDEKRYLEVISVCDLQYDFDLLANGDLTIVEDHGMNLSKGQQARINLARAVYRRSDIYLLDDCLASLDAQVQSNIFEKCIKEFLKNTVCVLVTHNVKLIREADQVILINQNAIESVVQTGNNSVKSILFETIAKKFDESTEKRPENADQNESINVTRETEDNSEDVKKLNDPEKEIVSRSNLYREHKKQGRVDFSNYIKYLNFGGGVLVTLFILGLHFAKQFSSSYLDKTLSEWVNVQSNITNLVARNETNSTKYYETAEAGERKLNLYFIMLLTSYGIILFQAFCFYLYISRISINIHKLVIQKVVYATMEFFDNTYIGNILNRFSRDMNIIDEELPFVFSGCLSLICAAVGVLGLISSVDYWFLIPSSTVFVLFLIMRRLYIPTGRSLKRLDCSTRSPVVGHLNTSIEGLTVIRAYGNQSLVIREFDRHQDLYTSTCHLSAVTDNGFGIALSLLSQMYISSILIYLLFNTNTRAGDAGLALTQAFSLNGILKWFVRQWAYLENQMTSVERVLEYTTVKQEEQKGGIIADWPKDSSLEYKNVSLTYEKTGETVLRNVSFRINPQEKVGVIGRTGAGKSSLISTIFRLYEIHGQIIIDDIDISTLSINFLRSKISIIPQDPVLFKATIRENIDPLNRLNDEELWSILDVVRLKDGIHSLEAEINGSDTQFSAGQRQLFCLARALVCRSKIVIMDEATANMDDKMSSLINDIVKEQFTSCTVLTISHKLDSVLDSDKILVMDRGEVVDFTSPTELLNNKHGLLYHMSEIKADED